MRSKMNRRFSSKSKCVSTLHSKAFQRKVIKRFSFRFLLYWFCEYRRCHHSEDTLVIQFYTFQCFLCVHFISTLVDTNFCLSLSLSSSLFYDECVQYGRHSIHIHYTVNSPQSQYHFMPRYLE